MTRSLTPVVVAALVACGGGAPATTPAVSNSPAVPLVEEATPTGQPRLELLSMGAEPRQPLRLAARVGAPAGADVVITMDTRSDAGEPQQMRMAFGWNGGVMNAGESLRIEGRIDRLEIDGVDADHGNLPFAYSLLPTAAVTSFDVLAEAPSMMDSALAESTRQSLAWLAVFPSAAVGVGARWRVDTTYEQYGMPVTMAVTSELVARNADRVVLRGGMTFRSVSDEPVFMEGTGKIDAELDLARVVPAATLTLTFKGEAKGDTTVKLFGESTMTLTPRR
jgi:uncharacterized protein YdeI (BOF family)